MNVSFAHTLNDAVDRELARRGRWRELEKERLRLEGSLSAFVEGSWPSISASQFRPGWCLDAMCSHLEAVRTGEIRRLLINIPPRSAKSSICSIAFPAWIWAQRERTFWSGPGVSFLCASYSHRLATDMSAMTRRLINSPWYQGRWGDHVVIRDDENSRLKFSTIDSGSRSATSVGGLLLGTGFDIGVIDDPHNVEGAESEAERESTKQWFAEFSSTRMNDPQQSSLILVMQRLNEDDLSGIVLSGDAGPGWECLMIPMEYESRRHCVTGIGWQDPRGLDDDGEPLVIDGFARDDEVVAIVDERENALMWPERFDRASVDQLKRSLGPYFASGRLQQSPSPKGGGIFQRDWWQLWESPDNKFPACDYVIASLDGAFTEDEENDPSALTVWGVFKHPEIKRKRIVLLAAWRKHLKFSGPRVERLSEPTVIDGIRWPADEVLPGMPENVVKLRNENYARRSRESWGLVEQVAHSCRHYSVDLLLIEGKASGISAAQELQNRFGNERWGIRVMPVKGDKVARALSAQPTFSQGMIYAADRAWADMVITEMANFPKGRFDDLTDSATQAINFLRQAGMAETDDETRFTEVERGTPRRQLPALYPV